MGILYFDRLPENALDNIVRFFSASPRAHNWPNFTQLENVHGLYDVHGEMGRFMLGRFTGVHVTRDFRRNNMDLNHLGVSNEGIIACANVFLMKLASSGRVIPSFQTLVVGALQYKDEARDYNLDSLSKQWPNICCLLFASRHVYQGQWLTIFGKNLATLYARNPNMDIPNHCTNLRHLYLRNNTWRGINRRMFWERIGKNLETISAHFFREVGYAEHLTKYCPKIKRLDITGDIDRLVWEQDVIAKCIASYGEQIEHAEINFTSESDLKLVKSACPNCNFSIRVSNKHELRMTLAILGHQLKAVEVACFDGSLSHDEPPADWNSCTNIESVKADGYKTTVSEIRCLMEKPKSLLKCIDLKLRCENEELKEIITLIAGGTGALKSLTLTCPDPAPDTFNMLVRRNPGLLYVKIGFASVLHEVKKIAVIEAFLKSPSLKKLKLDDRDSLSDVRESSPIPGIEDIRRSLRYRPICISAFDSFFLS